jgi:hypothetical protein
MALSFPGSPSVNDTYTEGGRTWSWNGTTWKVVTGAIFAGSVGTTEIANSAVTTAKIADATIVNADISSSAGINTTKITNWEDDQVILSQKIFR